MKSIFAIAMFLVSLPAVAQDGQSMPCMNSANTIQKNVCLRHAADALDKEVAVEVSRVEASLHSRDANDPVIRLAPAFEAAHAKWQQFREAECKFKSLSSGSGTDAPAAAAICEIEHGRKRLEYLKGLQ